MGLEKKYKQLVLFKKVYLIPARYHTSDLLNAQNKIIKNDFYEGITFTLEEYDALCDALGSTETFVDI